MNRLITFILVFLSIHLNAQKNILVKKTKIIVEQRDIYLNGALKAAASGQSRVTIPINLPKNTLNWYYSFSTSPGKSGTKNLNLALQLGSILADGTGITSKVMSDFKVPEGSDAIDVYLLDNKNLTPFTEKWDRNGGSFGYFQEGTTEKTKQAIVKIENIKNDNIYLGLRNPEIYDGVNITIEVIAIVSEEVYVDEWSEENKNILKNNCLNSFNTGEDGQNEVCNCLINSMIKEVKPSEWLQKNRKVQEAEITDRKLECFSTTNNLTLKNKEEIYLKEKEQLEESLKNKTEKLDKLIKESQAHSELTDYASAIKATKNAVDIIEKDVELKRRLNKSFISNLYNSLAWWSMLTKEMEDAGKYIRLALTYDNESMYVRGNLGLYHLLNNNLEEAKKAFSTYKRRKRLPDGRRWAEVVESDLKKFEDLGLGNKNFEEIRKLLKIK